jgi:hypothetical protein
MVFFYMTREQGGPRLRIPFLLHFYYLKKLFPPKKKPEETTSTPDLLNLKLPICTAAQSNNRRKQSDHSLQRKKKVQPQ